MRLYDTYVRYVCTIRLILYAPDDYYKYAPHRHFLRFQHLTLQTETHLKFVKRFKLTLIFGGSQLIYHVRLKLTLNKRYQVSCFDV
jgi:hypothetical protein